MDVNFTSDYNKYTSGILQSLSTQVALELPAITVITKCDLVENQENLEKSLNYFQNMDEEPEANSIP